MSYYKRKCSSLMKDEIVLFNADVYHDNHVTMYDGNVVSVDEENSIVTIVYLEGYKSRVDNIPFRDMVAVYASDGPYKKYGPFSGPSIDLIPE